jgi:hypothetical protein
MIIMICFLIYVKSFQGVQVYTFLLEFDDLQGFFYGWECMGMMMADSKYSRNM